MTDIIKLRARSFIILVFNLSTDDSYNKLLYELLSFCCCGLCSIVSFFFVEVLSNFITSFTVVEDFSVTSILAVTVLSIFDLSIFEVRAEQLKNKKATIKNKEINMQN